jgi:1-acyl-sn-glycerol-3-phosphate acyltransferase
VLYWFIRKIFMIFYYHVCRLQIEGREHLPTEGPVIVVSNHISFWDPPLVAAISPRRKLSFMAKAELFSAPVLGAILPRINVFPVKRGEPDRKAIRHSMRILASGDILAMFPEGTRSKTGRLQKPEPGVALLALKSQAPILPVAVINSDKILRQGSFFPRLTVRVGRPFRLDGYYDQKATREVMEKAGVKIMSAIAALLQDNSDPAFNMPEEGCSVAETIDNADAGCQ